MSLFGNLFNPKKWTLGTLFEAGGAAAGAGLIPGVGSGVGALIGGVGSMFSNNTYTPSQGNDPVLDALFGQQSQYALGMEPKRQQAVSRAYDLLMGDPNNEALVNRGRQMQFADLQGRRNRTTLLNKGYASGVGDAALLDARNQGTAQANADYFTLTSPMAQAQRAIQAAQLLEPNLANTLSGKMTLQNIYNTGRLADLQYEQSRPPSVLESILGIAGQVAPYMGKKKSSGYTYDPTGLFITGLK